MPRFNVRVPDGSVIGVDAPEGATEAQAIEFAASAWQPAKQAASSDLPSQIPGVQPEVPKPAAPSFLQRVGGAITSPVQTVREGVDTAALLASGLVGSPFAMAAGQLGGGTPREREARAVRYMGELYQPRTEAGARNIKAVGNALSQVGPLPELMGFGAGVAPAANRAVPAAANELALAGMAAKPVGNALAAVAKPIANVPGKIASEVVGLGTGAGAPAIREAHKAGVANEKTFLPNMRGQVSVEEPLVQVKQGLMDMQAARSKEYQTAKTGWAADTTPINFAPIDKAFNDITATLKEGTHSKIGSLEQAKVNEVRSVLDEWRGDTTAHTAVGLDALKQRVSAIYPDDVNQAQARRIISATENAVSKAIVDKVPEYAKAMKAYREETAAIRDISQALSLGDKASKDTAIRKLQSLMREAPGDKYRQEMLQRLTAATGVNITPALAGQALSNLTPSGLPKLSAGGLMLAAASGQLPGAAAVLPFTSPRLMGEAAYALGRGRGALTRAAGAAKNKIGNALDPSGFYMTPEQAAMLPYLTRANLAAGNQQ